MKGTHDGPTSRHDLPRHEMPSASTEGRSYLKLASELLIDFIIMFFVMYAMIASIDHLYFNIDNVYMTLMMVAPMAVLMLLFMRHMYRSNTANGIVAGLAIAVFALGWFGMRGQIAVGDEQLVRAMIPHHSGAILMCRQAKLSDPEVVNLCRNIIQSQEREIADMKRIEQRL